MHFELFGRNLAGECVFLGTFGKQEHVLMAIDEYYALGFRRLSFCRWAANSK